MIEKAKYLLTHPATAAAAALSVLGFAVKPLIFKAAFAVVWGNVGTIFTASSIFSFTIVPQLPVPGVVEDAGIGLTLVAGGVYLAKLLDRVYDAYQRKL